MDPSGKKGIFVGYIETSKAFKIYILGYKQIETSKDVTFDEDATFNKVRQILSEIHAEPEAPRMRVPKEDMVQED